MEGRIIAGDGLGRVHLFELAGQKYTQLSQSKEKPAHAGRPVRYTSTLSQRRIGNMPLAQGDPTMDPTLDGGRRDSAVPAIRAALESGDTAAATRLVSKASPSPDLSNVRAIVAMRNGDFLAALRHIAPAVLPNGVTRPPETIRDAWIVTYATALVLSGDVRGGSRALEWLKDQHHAGAARLRAAIAAGRDGQTWRQRLGLSPAPPVTLNFPPGEW